MPRNARCVCPGIPYHVTQRGTNRQKIFLLQSDREMYLNLLARNLESAQVRVLAYSLMTNHIHAVVVPEREDSLAVLFRRESVGRPDAARIIFADSTSPSVSQ